MPAFMRSWERETYALLRIVTGFLFLWYGMSKVFGFPSPPPPGAPPAILWTAGPIELVCGVLVMLGLFTRWAAFIASGQMAFAYWLGHGTHALLPIQNHGELAVLFCFVFLYVAARGPGAWSLDVARGAT